MEKITYKQIDRAIVARATLLDIEMDGCVDPQEYNEMHKEYCEMLDKTLPLFRTSA